MDPNTIIQEMEAIRKEAPDTIDKYFATKTIFENISKQEKTELARIASEYEGSEAERTRLALTHDTYITYLQGLAAARTEYRQAEAMYKRMEVGISLVQSQNKILTMQLSLT